MYIYYIIIIYIINIITYYTYSKTNYRMNEKIMILPVSCHVHFEIYQY